MSPAATLDKLKESWKLYMEECGRNNSRLPPSTGELNMLYFLSLEYTSIKVVHLCLEKHESASSLDLETSISGMIVNMSDLF